MLTTSWNTSTIWEHISKYLSYLDSSRRHRSHRKT